MKFKKLTVLALMACLVFTACGKGSGEENEVRNEDPVDQEAPADEQDAGSSASDAADEVTYITEGTVGDYIYTIEKDFAEGKKYYEDDLENRCWFGDTLDEPNAPIWIIISSGEKSHGGYDIGVVDITEEDGTIVITVAETAPNPEDRTTDEIVTPNVTVKFEYGTNGTPKDIKVVNTSGEEIPCAY